MNIFRPFKFAHGVDISDKMMRIVEAHQDKHGITVNAFAEVPIPAGVIVEGEIKNSSKAAELMKQLYSSVQGTVSSPFVIVAVPERKTFTKITTIDKLPEDEIDDAIQFEAEQHFPVSLEDTFLAWTLLETKKDAQKILLSATDKNIIEQYEQLFSEMDKYIIVAEPETFAVKRALIPGRVKPTLIIDLGKSKTTLSIVSDDVIVYTTTLQFSGLTLTKAIGKELHLSEDQAERAKLLFGMNPTKSKGVVRKLLIPLLEPLLNQVKDIIRYYTNTFEAQQGITKILLCGGGSQMEGLIDYMTDEIGIPTSTEQLALNPKSKLTKTFQQSKPLSYVTALGLALRTDQQMPFEMIE